MRVADYIFKYLADYGIRHVFLVVGGGAMHLNDALVKESRLKYVCNHHEQASAIAAEGYSRTAGTLSVVSVTSGPGGTNTLTGVIGQWLDSVPVLYLSGQVKFETTIASVPQLPLRQLGDQEINIVDIVRPVTKYAKMITAPDSIKTELRNAITLATSGRPGPVWLDIPLDVQASEIAVSPADFAPPQAVVETPLTPDATKVLARVAAELQMAKRPVLIAGNGIRLANATPLLLKVLDRLQIPVLTTFNGFDLVATEHSCFAGRIGTLGSRGGNFALQNADLAIFVGTRNNIRQISYNWTSFACRAKRVVIDIDQAEIEKPTVRADIPVRCDAGAFLDGLLLEMPYGFSVPADWLAWCRERLQKYPVVLEEYRHASEPGVNPYVFIEELTAQLDDNATVVAGNGTACVTLFQAGIVKSGQRQFWNSGCASMGYALPAAIGAAFATARDIVCITGDGSLQMNIQELQTVRHHGLPIKFFILNNGGYSSIRQTQTAFFAGNLIGCDPASGVTFPELSCVAALYGLHFCRISSTGQMRDAIRTALRMPGPVMCEVILPADYIFAPKLSSRRLPDGRLVSNPLEDLSPFLDRQELAENMIADKPDNIS